MKGRLYFSGVSVIWVYKTQTMDKIKFQPRSGCQEIILCKETKKSNWNEQKLTTEGAFGQCSVWAFSQDTPPLLHIF